MFNFSFPRVNQDVPGVRRNGSGRRSLAGSSAIALFVTAFLLVPATILQAADPPLVDTIYLKNGGTLYGTAEEIVENKQRLWMVTTTDGTLLKLKRSQVARVQKPSAEQLEYEEIKKAIADTVDDHWKMQQWCLDNRLRKEREYHLLRIIQLDPDHKDARARLGYKDFDGEWHHEEHFYSNQGYVKDGGAYRLPIAIEMKERNELANDQVAQWNKKIRLLTNRFSKRNDRSALMELAAITDPIAVPGLMKAYKESTNIALSKAIIDTLGQIKAATSRNALVVIATTTPDSQLDLAERAVNLLRQPHFSQAAACGTVIHWLNPADGSKIQSRLMVNRAAWLIGKLEYKPAIRALIDGLNTVHKVPIGGPQGNANTSFGDQGSGLEWGKKPTFRMQPFQNQPVLDTLRILAPKGINYDFNEGKWMAWYIQEHALPLDSLGRDH